MSTLIALASILGLGVFCLAFWYLPAFLVHHGKKTVNCPENSARADVQVNATRYAATSLLDTPVLELKSCSRWPERAGCGRACVAQLESAAQV